MRPSLSPSALLIPFAAAALTLTVAGCDDGKDGTTIAINASDADGNAVVGVDGKSGKLSIAAPGFTGSISLPKMHFDAGDFDMNGVHLYPGSTISGMNIDAHDKPGGDDDGKVRISFASPAAAPTVRDWFQRKLTGAGFTLSASGNGLAGTTDDHKPFRLDLTPAGADHADGTIVIG